MPSSLDCSSISLPPRMPALYDSSPPSFRRRGRRSPDKVVWDLPTTMETVPELEPLSEDHGIAIPVLDAHLGLNSSMLVLPEATPEAIPVRESSPQPGTLTATAGSDHSLEMTPLSPPTSEVEVTLPQM